MTMRTTRKSVRKARLFSAVERMPRPAARIASTWKKAVAPQHIKRLGYGVVDLGHAPPKRFGYVPLLVDPGCGVRTENRYTWRTFGWDLQTAMSMARQEAEAAANRYPSQYETHCAIIYPVGVMPLRGPRPRRARRIGNP